MWHTEYKTNVNSFIHSIYQLLSHYLPLYFLKFQMNSQNLGSQGSICEKELRIYFLYECWIVILNCANILEYTFVYSSELPTTN